MGVSPLQAWALKVVVPGRGFEARAGVAGATEAFRSRRALKAASDSLWAGGLLGTALRPSAISSLRLFAPPKTMAPTRRPSHAVGFLHPRRNVPLAVQYAPDLNVVRVLDIEHEMRVARQRPGTQAG